VRAAPVGGGDNRPLPAADPGSCRPTEEVSGEVCEGSASSGAFRAAVVVRASR